MADEPKSTVENSEGKSGCASATGSTPTGPNHLALAQKCFAGWLQELDGLLHDSELAYDEYAGKSGDMDAAGKSIYRHCQSLRLARLMIKAGLEAGV